MIGPNLGSLREVEADRQVRERSHFQVDWVTEDRGTRQKRHCGLSIKRKRSIGVCLNRPCSSGESKMGGAHFHGSEANFVR
jgi:hypothetical protein